MTTNEMMAYFIAQRAHAGQVDKVGKDYINHPLAVASRVDGELEKICALLHDVLEDTELSEKALRILMGDEVVDILLFLKHEDGVPYMDYIGNISKNPVATRVKLADLSHNMDLSRFEGHEITPRDLERQRKYEKARDFLINSQK